MTRLAELLAALSLATDAGRGYPAEKAIRTTLLSVRVAGELGVDGDELSCVYYASLLQPMGCTAFASEAVRTFGTDEVTGMPGFIAADPARPREAMSAVRASVRGARPARAARALVKNVTHGPAFASYATRADCEAAASFARRFGLGADVGRIVYEIHERWDGKGAPAGLRGDAIHPAARVIALADQAEIALRTGGRDETLAMVRRRSGGWFDPACARAMERCASASFAELDAGSVWDAVLAAEPGPPVTVTDARVDEIALGFADFADLKSPFFLGHARGVAALAEGAAERLGCRPAERTAIRRAALLQDLGRVAVSDLVWEKPGPLSPPEWEQVRLHAYHSERVLARSDALAALAQPAGMHHERLDGSGYHRGVSGASLPRAARILACADVYQALVSERPHRPAFERARATAEMETMVSAGALDHESAAAVCEQAGTPIRPGRASWPAGLTEREVDVLRLLAKGYTKKQIAAELTIAPGTVHTHTVRIYEKTAVSTRAGVALFAVEHGLA